MHTMCELYSDALENTIPIIEKNFEAYLQKCNWFNIGGGQLLADESYDLMHLCQCINYLKNKYQLQIILEPCEGLVMNTGYLASKVLDIVHNNISIAIMDASAICHLPNTLLAPYQCEILGASIFEQYPYQYQLAGNTCHPNDIWGTYYFKSPLRIGDNVFFCDTAQYSFVKSSMFNGISFPALASYSKSTGFQILKVYEYDTFLKII